MDCAKVHGLISPSLDGELVAAEQAALAAHLQSCAGCRAVEAGLREQRQLFAGLPRVNAPVGFHTRVMANLEPAPRAWHWWRRTLMGFAEVAFLGVIIFTGIVSGGFLVDRLNPVKTVAASLALDLFDPAPPDSLGGVYLAMTEVTNER